MKKLYGRIIVTVIILALCVISVSPIFAVQVSRLYGDIDNNGSVTIDDAIAALRAALLIDGYELYGIDFTCADVNKDGELNTVDARIILRMTAGLEKKEEMDSYEFEFSADALLNEVNTYRDESGQSLTKYKLSNELCDAATVAAEEFAEKSGNALKRADGTAYYTLLDDFGIKYTGADKIICISGSDYKKAVKAMSEELQSKQALLSPNMDTLGAGVYTRDGRTFYWCVLLIRK